MVILFRKPVSPPYKAMFPPLLASAVADIRLGNRVADERLMPILLASPVLNKLICWVRVLKSNRGNTVLATAIMACSMRLGALAGLIRIDPELKAFACSCAPGPCICMPCHMVLQMGLPVSVQPSKRNIPPGVGLLPRSTTMRPLLPNSKFRFFRVMSAPAGMVISPFMRIGLAGVPKPAPNGLLVGCHIAVPVGAV